jgi:hypothetical protein
MPETPLEAQAVMESAVEAIGAALRRLDSAALAKRSSAAPRPGDPTRHQGQFLAFIREYLMRNEAGVAPGQQVVWAAGCRTHWQAGCPPPHGGGRLGRRDRWCSHC